MPETLTQSAISKLEYKQQALFAGGLIVMKKKDGRGATVYVQKKYPTRLRNGRSPVCRAIVGYYPDQSIDDLQAEAARARTLISKGINPAEAKAEAVASAAATGLEKDRRATTLNQLLISYDEVSNNKASTKRGRRSSIERHYSEWMDSPASSITTDMINRHLKTDNENRAGGAETAFRYLKSVLQYGVTTKELMLRNPCIGVNKSLRRRVIADPNKKNLVPSTCQKILSIIGHLSSSHSPLHPFIYAGRNSVSIKQSDVTRSMQIQLHACSLLLLTGLRKSDLLGLKWSEVHLEEQDYASERRRAKGPYIELIQGKRSTPHAIPVTSHMLRSFNRLSELRVNQYVFPSPRPALKEAAPIKSVKGAAKLLNRLVRSDIPIHAAACRTTFASSANEVGYSLDAIDLMRGYRGYVQSRGSALNHYVGEHVETYRDRFEQVNAFQLYGSSYREYLEKFKDRPVKDIEYTTPEIQRVLELMDEEGFDNPTMPEQIEWVKNLIKAEGPSLPSLTIS